MKLIYEGIDITKKVAINRCVHETYAENRADTLTLRFSDAASRWDSWQPRRGDTVQFEEDAANTGKMFVASLMAENGLFALHATAMPLTGDNAGSKSWENVRLFQLCDDIAKKHGLAFEHYDAADQLYPFIRQEQKTDFAFLNTLCQMEGYALILYNGKLVIYDEHAREGTEATTDIKVGPDGRFAFSDNSAQSYGAIELVSGTLRGTFSDPTAPAERILRIKAPLDCTGRVEAQRFAKGLLRQANKNAFTGSFRRGLTPDIAAGSVVQLNVEKAANWSGRIFVTRTRHDYVNGETKIFFRRPLEGY